TCGEPAPTAGGGANGTRRTDERPVTSHRGLEAALGAAGCDRSLPGALASHAVRLRNAGLSQPAMVFEVRPNACARDRCSCLWCGTSSPQRDLLLRLADGPGADQLPRGQGRTPHLRV